MGVCLGSLWGRLWSSKRKAQCQFLEGVFIVLDGGYD